MKKTAMIAALILLLTMGLFGCGSSDKEGELFQGMDLAEYVTVPDWYGVEVDPAEEITVSDEEVQTEITARLQDAVKTDYLKEGVVADGDTVNIDYTGTVDGVEFSGGKTDPAQGGQNLVIGSNSFIEGFEGQLIGASVGDTVEVHVTFPEVYKNPDLQGKDAVFTVVINSLVVSAIPEFDDAFVTEQGFKSKADYEKSVYEELLAAAEDAQLNTRQQQAWSYVVENSEVLQYPEEELQKMIDGYNQYTQTMVSGYGYTMDEYMQMTGMDQEALDQETLEYCQEVLRNEMVLYYIVHEEDMSVSKDEYNEGVLKQLQQAGYADEAAFEEASGSTFEEYVGVENIYISLYLERVLDLIMENSVETQK